MLVDRRAFVPQIVRPDQRRIAGHVAAREPALLEHRHVGDPVVLDQVVRSRQSVSAAADDHDVVRPLGLGIAPEEVGMIGQVRARCLWTHALSIEQSLQLIYQLWSTVWYFDIRGQGSMSYGRNDERGSGRDQRGRHPRPTLDLAYRIIRERLIMLDIRPSEPINDEGLARELGFGRTPVREALKRLERDRLVIAYPRRGTFATTVDITDLAHIQEIREATRARRRRSRREHGVHGNPGQAVGTRRPDRRARPQ